MDLPCSFGGGQKSTIKLLRMVWRFSSPESYLVTGLVKGGLKTLKKQDNCKKRQRRLSDVHASQKFLYKV